MLTLKDYVNWGLTHCDKTASAEGVPLVLENCKKNKRMKELDVFGESVQNSTPTPENPVEVESVGELVTDVNDANYGKYKVPVSVKGKNLVDLSEFVSRGKMKLNDVSTGEYEFSNTSNMPNLYVDFTYVDYYVVRCEVMAVKEQSIIISGRDASGVSINGVGFSVAGIVGEWKTVTKVISKADISDIAYFIFGGGGGLATGTKIRGLQIERGSVATEYEPYVEPITTNVYLNEPLRKFGDYADVLDFKSNKIIRNIRELVFDGTESWELLNTGNANLRGFMHYVRSPYLRATSYVADGSLCNMYPVVKSRTDKTLSGQSSSRSRFDFVDLDYADVDAWKAHLVELNTNGTPLKIAYALELPYEEPIKCELPILETKTSIVEVATSLLPSNIKGKYIKK